MNTLIGGGLAENYDLIRDLLERSLFGFDEYNVRVRQTSGFALPNPPRDSQTFSTPSEKAQFMTHPLPDVSVGKDQFVLMTLRSLTSTTPPSTALMTDIAG